MVRHATETYYLNKIARLEADKVQKESEIAKKEAKIQALKAKLSDLTDMPVDNEE